MTILPSDSAPPSSGAVLEPEEAMPASKMEIQKLSAYFGKFRAIHGIDIQVPPYCVKALANT